MYKDIINDLHNKVNPEKAKILSSFFKTSKWWYWEWDRFLWIQVPDQRIVAKRYFQQTNFTDISHLLASEFHEIRLTWFLILCYKYEYCVKKHNTNEQESIIKFYTSNLKYANNWDLVDLTCYKILWHYLLDKDRTILYEFAQDKNMRKQRIAIVATMAFVKKWELSDTLKISEMLLNHPHDLIHKAVGWLLREVWKQNENVLRDFLNAHINGMNRTTLRYAIERLDSESRTKYLNMIK